MKRLVLAAALAAGTLAVASRGEASPIVHDSISKFAVISLTAGAGFPTSNPARNSIANMFDADPVGTFLSLGRGGEITLVIDPTSNRITSALTIERTNLPSRDQERVNVFLGVNGGGFVEIGALLNTNLGGGVIDAGAVADLSTSAVGSGTSARTSYQITNIVGDFNTIRFVDASNSTSGDGFDIATLSVTSNAIGAGPSEIPVPGPSALLLLGAGLFGLGLARRRRAG
ncbi:MAG: PEP-CTERM sorting domain-containing protein [Rubritepida sp.]|jgi:hypothetical protein|nr:PEP-CTERM sorting domain-containing protein [Rubritepida sp.]